MAKILLVDDEPEVAGLMSDWLRLRGYDVLRAADGIEALRVARSDGPDLILLDAFMPGLDGLETGRRLRAQPETRQLPIVLISGEDAAGAQVDRLMAGASDAVTRPIALDDLGRRLRALLDPGGTTGADGRQAAIQRADALARAAVGAAVAGLPCQMAWLFGPDDPAGREGPSTLGTGWVGRAAAAPGHPEALPNDRSQVHIPPGDPDYWLARPLHNNIAAFNLPLDDIHTSPDDLIVQACVRLGTGYLTLIPLNPALPGSAISGLLLLASRDPLDMAQETIRRGLLAATNQASLALEVEWQRERADLAPSPSVEKQSTVPEGKPDTPRPDMPRPDSPRPGALPVGQKAAVTEHLHGPAGLTQTEPSPDDGVREARSDSGSVANGRTRFQALREATLAALIAPSLDAALQAIISQAARALNVKLTAALLLVARGGDTLVVHRAAGLRARRLEDAAVLLDGSLTGEALQAGHPALFKAGDEPMGETSLVEDLVGLSVRAAAAAPLVVRGENAGALLAVNPGSSNGAGPAQSLEVHPGQSPGVNPASSNGAGHFTQEDIDLLQSLANLAAISMGGSRLAAEMAGRAHGLTVLHRAAAASSSQPLTALLDSITRLVLDGLAVKACVVRSWDSGRDELSTLARRIDYRRGVAPRRVTLRDWPPARQAIQAGAAVRVSGSLRETRGGEGMRSLMLVPVDERTLAVLGHPSASQVFTDEHVMHCRDAAEDWKAAGDSPEDLAQALLAAVEAPWCVVYTLEADRETLLRAAEVGRVSFGARGPEADQVDTASLRRSLLAARKTIAFGAADDRLSETDRALGSPFETGQTLMTPILYYGQPLGLIEALDDNLARSFAEHDRLILQAVASLIGAAIGRERTGGPPRPLIRPETQPAGQGGEEDSPPTKPLDPAEIRAALDARQRTEPPEQKEAADEDETPNEEMPPVTPVHAVRPAWIAVRQSMASLENAARDAVDELLPAAAQAGVTIMPFYGEFLPDVFIDRDRILQVITILLENAIRHSPRGSRVTLTLRQMGQMLQVEIADHGDGIPLAEQATIWAKGVSDDPQKIRGLALASQVIKAHDGRIWLVSQPGSGSAFAFSLPTAELSGMGDFIPSF